MPYKRGLEDADTEGHVAKKAAPKKAAAAKKVARKAAPQAADTAGHLAKAGRRIKRG